MFECFRTLNCQKSNHDRPFRPQTNYFCNFLYVFCFGRNHVLGVTMASTVKQQFGGAKIFLVHTHTPAITLSVDVDHH